MRADLEAALLAQADDIGIAAALHLDSSLREPHRFRVTGLQMPQSLAFTFDKQLGKGGFGAVYSGQYGGKPAAFTLQRILGTGPNAAVMREALVMHLMEHSPTLMRITAMFLRSGRAPQSEDQSVTDAFNKLHAEAGSCGAPPPGYFDLIMVMPLMATTLEQRMDDSPPRVTSS